MHFLGFRFAPPQAIIPARLRRLRARLSPFGRVAFIGIARSGACRAVAREARALRVGWSAFEPLKRPTACRFRPLGEFRFIGWGRSLKP